MTLTKTLLALLTFAPTLSFALVMEPTYQAADSLGFQVVGEVEFPRGQVRPPSRQMIQTLNEVGELCPRTQALHSRIYNPTRFVVLAWPDREYPRAEVQSHSTKELSLAHARGQTIARELRRHVAGELSFVVVNMASRQPQLIKVTSRARVEEPSYNIKEALRISGAAPTDELEVGLFGEYAQKSKAIIWVDCVETFSRPRKNAPKQFQLAQARDIL